ncbi:hypothetical protein IGI04_013375 [Brassica rapa subsp. trilocularis]|uniref:Uncharacterized protein n=1 Tax=Brassica rapa subsp. trilocularis TaxID=1813537 RepID=A0ABQ7NAU1_BRACM|nr:hypothetical protein IGI04_013375 [Brassica rapa subsp. trilocularis]
MLIGRHQLLIQKRFIDPNCEGWYELLLKHRSIYSPQLYIVKTKEYKYMRDNLQGQTLGDTEMGLKRNHIT